MGKESIIAQVDHSTEQIMKEITHDITSAIETNLQDIKDDTKIITDIIAEQTDEITRKLSGFDGLSTSLTDLKEFARESKTLADKISPLESSIQRIQYNVVESISDELNSLTETICNKTETKNNDVISSIKILKTILEGSQFITTEISQHVLAIINFLSEYEEVNSNKLTGISDYLNKIVRSNEEFRSCSLHELEKNRAEIASVKEKQLETASDISKRLYDITGKQEEELTRVKLQISDLERTVKGESESLNTRIDSLDSELKKMASTNTLQFDKLTESVEKIQVTLDIVVNLTTPFWKKWNK